ncbi:MAG: type VI secretion system-associated protein TagF [Burkholderiales bacterium]|nr:type VI secretion system-associated protein TagF [Burkholderiales bacterium]
MSRHMPTEIIYFGKLPARGDFVRNGDAQGLTERLDLWLTQGIERLAREPRWKEVYDQAPSADFAFLGVKRRAVVAGHLMASTDASGRRFPFVAVGKLEVEAPLPFMQRAPMALSPLWLQLGQAADRAHAADDVVPALNLLDRLRPAVDIDPRAHDAGYREFLELHTLGSLQALLRDAAEETDLRRALLGLGLLLAPVPGSGAQRLERGVRLPMPADPQLQPLVATLWLDLAARFLARSDFEVALFLPRRAPDGTASGAPGMALGFSGDSPALLHALLDPGAGGDHFVDLFAPEWVDDSAELDYPLRKLNSYLPQPALSLAQARATFNEAFLGE